MRDSQGCVLSCFWPPTMRVFPGGGLWSRVVELFVTLLLEHIMFVKRLAVLAVFGAVFAFSISPVGAEILGPAATPSGPAVSPVDLGSITGTIIDSYSISGVTSLDSHDRSNFTMNVLQDSSRGNQLDFLYQWTYVSSTAPTSDAFLQATAYYYNQPSNYLTYVGYSTQSEINGGSNTFVAGTVVPKGVSNNAGSDIVWDFTNPKDFTVGLTSEILIVQTNATAADFLGSAEMQDGVFTLYSAYEPEQEEARLSLQSQNQLVLQALLGFCRWVR